jgi:hypothetical protein
MERHLPMNLYRTIKNLIPRPVRRFVRQMSLGKRAVNLNQAHDAVFTEIYQRNSWGDPESASGAGSNKASTVNIRKELPRIIQEFDIRSIVDVPCGDFAWMKEVDLPIDRYIGGDIVAPLIEENQKKYGNDKRRFMVLDLSRDPIPECDLIFCRDCLMHLSMDLILEAMRNMLHSKAKYLLTTSYEDGENAEIRTGEWFAIDLLIPPFSFPEPLRTIEDLMVGGMYRKERRMRLWHMDDLRKTPFATSLKAGQVG